MSESVSGLNTLPLSASQVREIQNTHTEVSCEGDSPDDPPARMEADLADFINKAGVASVPNEILSAIFEAGCHLLPRPQPSDSSSETDEWEPPFEILVSHVTRHWRNVAVSTPSLWTQIYIAEQDQCLDAAAAYLTRSRCLPLDIGLEMGRPHPRSRWHPKLPSTCSIIETLTPHVGRCRRFCIHSERPRRHLSALLKGLCSVTCPFLESIQVSRTERFDYYDDGDADYSKEDEEDEERDRCENVREIFAGGAPSLKEIRLRGINLSYCLPPTASVTTLHIHCDTHRISEHPSYRVICALFSNFRALTHLVLQGCFVRYSTFIGVPIQAPTVTFPLLSSLCILSTKGHTSLFEFLAMISAPLLECLSFGEMLGSDAEEVLQTPEWIATLPRYPYLHTLSVIPLLGASPPFQPSTWKTIEQSFNTVTNLTVLDEKVALFSESLYCMHGTDLSPSPSNQIPWPNLQTLSLGGFQFPYDIEPFVAALAARVVMDRPLRKLRIPRQPGMPENQFRDALLQFQRYTEVEEYKPKRWPRGDLNDWYDGN